MWVKRWAFCSISFKTHFLLFLDQEGKTRIVIIFLIQAGGETLRRILYFSRPTPFIYQRDFKVGGDLCTWNFCMKTYSWIKWSQKNDLNFNMYLGSLDFFSQCHNSPIKTSFCNMVEQLEIYDSLIFLLQWWGYHLYSCISCMKTFL